MDVLLGDNIDTTKLLSGNRLRYNYGEMSCTITAMNGGNSMRVVKSQANIPVEDAVITIENGRVRFTGTHHVERPQCIYDIVYSTDGRITNVYLTLDTNLISINYSSGGILSITEEGGLDVSDNEDYRRAFAVIAQYERKRLTEIVELIGRMYLTVNGTKA